MSVVTTWFYNLFFLADITAGGKATILTRNCPATVQMGRQRNASAKKSKKGILCFYVHKMLRREFEISVLQKITKSLDIMRTGPCVVGDLFGTCQVVFFAVFAKTGLLGSA
jgi:hypothetical protein